MAKAAVIGAWIVVSVAVFLGLYRLGARRQALVIRVGIAIMAIDHVQNGLHAVASPSSFYRLLPGSGGGPLDTFTLTLVRDMGAARLTLALVLIAAGVMMDRRVLGVAFAAATVSGVIRLVDHLVGVRAEGWMNWVGYTLAAVLPIILWTVARRNGNRSAEHIVDTA